ncbi:hypothetical protein E2C01_038825 [Portunus trituberculatus]|uniref:Uncharacterized protein n=1 Tax=Portunus trituberculatus TaxID=210409 RepID=A0A5B7FBY6_PORTR|nr:hypothetical protein [Portunus trituberculatus]
MNVILVPAVQRKARKGSPSIHQRQTGCHKPQLQSPLLCLAGNAGKFESISRFINPKHWLNSTISRASPPRLPKLRVMERKEMPLDAPPGGFTDKAVE